MDRGHRRRGHRAAGLLSTPIRFSFAKLIGPGLLVAAAGLGAGDIVSATSAGAGHGLSVLWAVAIAVILKAFLIEGIARWQLGTGTTVIEGWCTHLPWWVHVYFGLYLTLWTVAVSAALTNAGGLGLAHLTDGAIPASWGAVLHAVAGCVLVLIGGFKGFERVMKVLIGVMFFSIVTCAALTLRDPVAVLEGLFVPTIPSGAGPAILSLLGGIGGSIVMLAYNYWLREQRIAGPQWLGYVRIDITIAYLFTGIFGISVIVLAHQAFFVAGVAITDEQAVPRMAEMLGASIGPFGYYAFSIGFWATVFTSVLGVWQGLPYLFADYYGLLRKRPPSVRDQLTRVTSNAYRVSLFFITLVAIPFAFVDRPLFIIVGFTIVGSLFIPFLAATLLYMNNALLRADGGVPRNSMLTNAVLIFALVLFTLLSAHDIGLF